MKTREVEEEGRWGHRHPSQGGSLSHRPRARQVANGGWGRPAEAEDAVARSASHSALYYSPPGTSYTIVEHKKRPISPEQVLKMLGGGRSRSRDRGEGCGPPAPAPAPASLLDPHVRTVNMSRGGPDTASHGFGICVKGGNREPGSHSGVYISRVEEGSVAERAGLRSGDSILQVNGTPFTNISHEEALKVLKSCRELSMTVRSVLPYYHPSQQPPPHPQAYTWVDRRGRPASPPPKFRQYHRDKLRKVELVVEAGQSLGLMIRGGVEYSLGIFITGVDKESVADRAGLLIGDQILEVNGQSFLEVSHDEAVAQLKSTKRMSLKVYDVGKVPHSCSTLDTHYIDNSHRCCVAALQMVDEKARVVLNKNEFNTLTYYLDEYSARQMTIDAFVAVLLELLNSPDKQSLFTELRELVDIEDRNRYDELVYRRDQYIRRCPPCCDNSHDMIMTSLHHMSTPLEYDSWGAEEAKTPSEDSGVGLGPHDQANPPTHRRETRAVGQRPQNNPQPSDTTDQEVGSTQVHNNNYDASMELGRPSEEVRPGQDGREDNMASPHQPVLPQVTADEAGNLRVVVRKCKPLLGIAIEGGANTRHPLPRIININENGAAYEAGGLQVGQLILEVDGIKVEGLPHQEIARLIAESFAQRDKPHIEFLVIEAKKSNLEPKPTALIFLEA